MTFYHKHLGDRKKKKKRKEVFLYDDDNMKIELRSIKLESTSYTSWG